MQNLSNATRTRFQLNSIPEKNSKNVKKVFLPFLSLRTLLLYLLLYEEKEEICVATGKIISSHSDFPPLPYSESFSYTFLLFLLCYFLHPCVCYMSEKRFSSFEISGAISHLPTYILHIFPLMKWYHEHSFEIKYAFLFWWEIYK